MVTDVGAPLFVNVAVMSGTVLGVGVEFQLLPGVHSLETGAPPPIQVPSVACAPFGANTASGPSQTLPSSAARLKAGRTASGAIRIALPRTAARGAAGAAAPAACERHRYERIPQPLRAAPAARVPIIARAVPRARTIAPRPTLRAEPVTLNSGASFAPGFAAACGFLATPLRRFVSRMRCSAKHDSILCLGCGARGAPRRGTVHR